MYYGGRNHAEHREPVPHAQAAPSFGTTLPSLSTTRNDFAFVATTTLPDSVFTRRRVSGRPRHGRVPRQRLQFLPVGLPRLVHGQGLGLPGGERQVTGVVIHSLHI